MCLLVLLDVGVMIERGLVGIPEPFQAFKIISCDHYAARQENINLSSGDDHYTNVCKRDLDLTLVKK